MKGTRMGIMRMLTSQGDTPTITWDEADQGTIDEAFSQLTSYLAGGMLAFASSVREGTHEREDVRLRQGDPFPASADEVIIIPHFPGG